MCEPVTTLALIGAGSAATGAVISKKLAPKAPDITQTDMELPAPAEISDPAAVQASQRERRRRAAAYGRRSTILTSPSGASASQTAPVKTLLGA